MKPETRQPQNLVEPSWLAENLEEPDVVVVDCRFSLANPSLGRQQYETGHIPGAYYLDLNRDMSSPVQLHGGRHPLPNWDTFVESLEGMGISSPPESPTLVIAYDDSRCAFAARLWWMLKYLGHDSVAVLNGGLQGWQGQGHRLSQEWPAPNSGKFTPQPRTDWLVDIDHVRRRKDDPGVVLIDSRSPERFRGETEPIDPIAGSIPGAVNYFWRQMTSDQEGRLKSQADLVRHWSAIDADEEVIIYCGSGVTACVNLLSQAIAGMPLGRLYVGGWSDWCSYIHQPG